MSLFQDSATKLAGNPLGIIALFLVLIYSIASLTFMFAKNLPQSLIPYFVIFILTYPVVVLVAFYRLVTKHHTKLYAPKDFIIPEQFMECVYGDQQNILTRQQVTKQISHEPTEQIEGES